MLQWMYQRSLIDGIFQCFTSTEARNFTSRNGQLFTRLWVTACTSCTLTYRESTETNQCYFITALQSFGNGVHECI
ncbi:hypothetical protein DEU53_10844 [Pantoea sp. AG1095]|nr:hypothetical protein DEU53_10844 [Pantoea sp. AG1095]